MSKPWIHAKNSAKKFGGTPEDYIDIHNFLDSSKSAIPNNFHRVLTHNSWFIGPDGPLERAFGVIRINSEGKEYSIRDVGEQHILEDFGMKFIPTVQDYLTNAQMPLWVNNAVAGAPASAIRTTQIENPQIVKLTHNELISKVAYSD